MKTNKPPIKHIWFDFAGTLYRETADLKVALQQHAYKVYAGIVGTTDMQDAKDAYDVLYKVHGSRSAVFRSLGKPDDYWQTEADSFNRQKFFSPDEEVTHTLQKLHEQLPISLFTNFQHSKIEELLAHLKIPKRYFTYILSGEDVSVRKPELEGFYKMIEISKLPANEVMYVGDREAVDIIPAHTVGMQTCLLYGESKTADYCFGAFKDLLTLVKVTK